VLPDRGANLERLGRTLGEFEDHQEVAVTVNLAERIAAGRRRVAEAMARNVARSGGTLGAGHELDHSECSTNMHLTCT